MNTALVIAFLVVAALLIIVALVLLLPPLLGRRRRRAGPDTARVNAAVYRARLDELERDVGDGALDTADFEQAKAELEREVLDSVVPDAGQQTGKEPSPAVAACVAVLLPVLAVGIYLALGAPGSIASLSTSEGGGDGMEIAVSELDREALERMTASFAERLAKSPGEGDGWLVLARAYMMLDEFPKAVAAFARANALLGDVAEVLIDYAEAEALANENRFSQQARARIEKALRLAPRNEKGLWLGAFAAAQHGDIDAALSYWQMLLHAESDPDRRELIQGLIARVAGAPPPGDAAGAAPAAPAAVGDTPGVKIRVVINDALRQDLAGSETVFVFARDVVGGGVPLAVYRTRVDALPATVTLDDSMSMVPNLGVSGRDRVTVTARVSLSGNARPRSGDLQGNSGPVDVGNAAPVQIAIDQRLP